MPAGATAPCTGAQRRGVTLASPFANSSRWCESKAPVFLFREHTGTDEQSQQAMQRGGMRAGSVCKFVGGVWSIRKPVGNP